MAVPVTARVILGVTLLLAACETAPSAHDAGRRAYLEGYEALKAADYAGAERSLSEAARELPEDPYVQLDLGVTEQNLGKRDLARAAYARAMDLGKTAQSRDVTDPRYAGRTVAQLAKDDLDWMALPPP